MKRMFVCQATFPVLLLLLEMLDVEHNGKWQPTLEDVHIDSHP
ncbi:hypothetical protein [Nitrosomonas mobilis]|nr:hypothetical protein [Nitrosomonas mobilis]HNO74724.1 hypothetical protein [Nitrosomonas mobilis]